MGESHSVQDATAIVPTREIFGSSKIRCLYETAAGEHATKDKSKKGRHSLVQWSMCSASVGIYISTTTPAYAAPRVTPHRATVKRADHVFVIFLATWPSNL